MRLECVPCSQGIVSVSAIEVGVPSLIPPSTKLCVLCEKGEKYVGAALVAIAQAHIGMGLPTPDKEVGSVGVWRYGLSKGGFRSS